MGFLEFYEREDTDKLILAPLLALPVTIEKGGIDPETQTYRYTISYSGEDINENHTLREKLRTDFGLHLPIFNEDAEPTTYLRSVKELIKNNRRWNVVYRLSLGFLSFGKLAIWDDLDPKKWPGLLNSSLLKEVFSGGTVGNDTHNIEDYEIDKRDKGDPEIVFDADSSQHSAIIDVLSGKNLVINGPPGTGKSQTIANIIAAGLNMGKKILFVSEKLAALEVVRRNLDKAHLGHFCLELHSHKTQKSRLISDLQERVDLQLTYPTDIQPKMNTLWRLKVDLNRYSELMSAYIGNNLGLTIYDVFWRTERLHRDLGDIVNTIQIQQLESASKWSLEEVKAQQEMLERLGQLYAAVGNFDSKHPWWGFAPRSLAPGDNDAIGHIIYEVSALSDELNSYIIEYQHYIGITKEPSLSSLEVVNGAFKMVPDPPDTMNEALLVRVFDSRNPPNDRNRALLYTTIKRIEEAKDLASKANELLYPNAEFCFDDINTIISSYAKYLKPTVITKPLSDLEMLVANAITALDQFKLIITKARFRFSPVRSDILNQLNEYLKLTDQLNLAGQQLKNIRAGADLLTQEIARLEPSSKRIYEITCTRKVPFAGTPQDIAMLSNPEGIENILRGVVIDDNIIANTQKAAAYLPQLSDLPIRELSTRQQALYLICNRIGSMFNELEEYARQLDMPFDGTRRAITYLTILSNIAEKAPISLMDYRSSALAQYKSHELLKSAEDELQSIKLEHESLEGAFYLDILPDSDTLIKATLTFRRGDSFFNIFQKDWRDAIKVMHACCRDKNKHTAAEYEKLASKLLSFVDRKAAFITNEDYKSTFGLLYNGLNSDFSKIGSLLAWYGYCQSETLKYPGINSALDLLTADSMKIEQLAAMSSRIPTILNEIELCRKEVGQLLESNSTPRMLELNNLKLSDYIQSIKSIEDGIKNVISYLGRYVTFEISPNRAVELLNAKKDLLNLKDDLSALSSGIDLVQGRIEPLLPGFNKIGCSNWINYLIDITNIANVTNKLVLLLSEYSENESTPGMIKAFFEAKLALDNALDGFAQTFTSTSWNSYMSESYNHIHAAVELIKCLKPLAKNDSSVSEIMEGIKAKQTAAKIIQSLDERADVADLLQDNYNGLNTDLFACKSTLSWGESVVDKEAFLENSLISILISPQASSNYYNVNSLIEMIIKLNTKIAKKIQELTKWGQFSWDDWKIVGHSNINDAYLASDIHTRMEFAKNNIDAILPLSKYISLRDDCKNAGYSALVNALEKQLIPSTLIGHVFEFLVFRRISDNIYLTIPELDKFSTVAHEQKRSDFIKLDSEIISHTGGRFAYNIFSNAVVPRGTNGLTVADKSERYLLLHELGKQRRHLPIRQLIKRAGRAIQAYKPCFMMGPLSVAQYMEQGAVEFDIVIMDEASQLRPEEALGAIARGKQLVVVGDRKQLPPTNFFDRLVERDEDDEDDNTPAALTDSESILDICTQVFHPARTLRWHYRSQHQALIAFSNYHFYDGKLIIFPSPIENNNRLGVRYRYITNGIYQNRQNIPEAQLVVSAIIEHFIKCPNESLAVVTLNQTQRDLIDDLLDKKIRNIKEAQTFIDRWSSDGWPFFIKNLENVQGDERDVIIVSLTFGKAPGTDNVRQNFGPISRSDGWRRLNVLFTRARRKIELFTSMSPEDIVFESKTPEGTRTLRAYLDYAQRGVLATTSTTDRDPDSDFEVAVGDMLKNKGFEIEPQLGVAGFYIDIAVRNPKRRGEFLAAIECDGATYHSGKSARDRDRIRQSILESLGWKDRIWRIWSTAWFANPKLESERLLSFLDSRLTIVSSEPEPETFSDERIEYTFEPNANSEQLYLPDGQIIGTELGDWYVELGDRVTYCFLDKPDEPHSVTIIDGESNPRYNIINENTALAKALINLAEGDIGDLEVINQPIRSLRVLKIQR